MTRLKKTILGATLGTGALALSLASASAAIVCSGNVCWHVKEHHNYPAEAGVKIYADDWKWGPHEKYQWREHEGRGYWRQDKWITW